MEHPIRGNDGLERGPRSELSASRPKRGSPAPWFKINSGIALALAASLLFGIGPVWADVADVRISGVQPGASGEQWAELLNAGLQPVSLDGVWLASDGWAGLLKGLDAVPPGGRVVVHWNRAGATKGPDFYTGPAFPWSASRGNLALQRSSQPAAADMLAYLQWGAANQPRSDLAEAAGLWLHSDFLPAVADGYSLVLAPGGFGRSPQDWFEAAQPTPGAADAGAASAWRGWSMLPGRAFLDPALTFDVDRSVLDLAAIDANGAPVHYRFQQGAWTAGMTLNQTTALPAALATSADGTVELVVVGSDHLVYHNRFINGSWTGFAAAGAQQTALPPALAYNLWARTLELVVVGLDGQLAHNRFANGKWGAWNPVGAAAGGPPVLGVSTQDSAFDLLFSTVSQSLFRSHFALGSWGNPEATMGQTRLRPAVAAGVGGNLYVAITGTDGLISYSRYLAGRWTGWTSLNKASDLPPALALNLNTDTLELVAVGRDRVVSHTRQINGHWTAWLPLGAVSAAAPALVQGDGDNLELVVAGEDRSLWHNRFLPASQDLVSFSSDVLPIFANACATCHSGSAPPMGLNLDKDHAYNDTVFASARERHGMFRITPLDPDHSYLFHKVDGTQIEAGGSGVRMPLGGQLSLDEIDKIRAWIAQGALNN